MKKLKIIFIIWLVIIFTLFVIDWYTYSQIYNLNTNTYVTLIKWEGFIKNNLWEIVTLNINKKNILNKDDEITTLKDSFAIIKWWDNSLTRLSENAKIKILENQVNNDLSKINIKFNILKWVSWSNIVSIIWTDSYFNADIWWVEAAVRWTTFLADADNKNIYVDKHQVTLIYSSWETLNVNQWEWINLENKKIILEKINKFYRNFIKLNLDLDLKYAEDLKKKALERIKKELNMVSGILFKIYKDQNAYINVITWEKELSEVIWGLSEEQKKQLKSKLNQTLQTINFEKWLNNEIFNLKQNLKKELINSNLINETYKEQLVKYSLYDLSDLKILDPNNKNYKILYSKTQEIFQNKYFENIKIDFEKNTEVLKNVIDIFNINK